MGEKPRDLIRNGSFEKNLHNWILTDDVVDRSVPHSGVYGDGASKVESWDSRFGFDYAHPSDGAKAMWTAWDGPPGQITLSQVVSLAHTKSDILTFDVQAGWDLQNYGAKHDRTFTVEVTDNKTGKVTDFTVLTAHAGSFESGAEVLHETLDLSAFHGREITLSFVWDVPDTYDGPASFTLDNIQLIGGAQSGSKHDDRLIGSEHADVLSALAGADVLTGGHGGDVLTGGAGADRFVFTDVSDSHGAGVDEITDLKNKDVIDLSAIDADHQAVGDQAFTLVHAFDGGRGQAMLSWDLAANQTVLSLDLDGDRNADMQVRLDGHHTGFDHFVL